MEVREGRKWDEFRLLSCGLQRHMVSGLVAVPHGGPVTKALSSLLPNGEVFQSTFAAHLQTFTQFVLRTGIW